LYITDLLVRISG